MAVYEGVFGTPKTDAGTRRVPLSEATLALLTEWRARVKRTAPDAHMFSTWSGKPISPHNVTRRWIVPACTKLRLPKATWLTFRRTDASWSHDQGVGEHTLHMADALSDGIVKQVTDKFT